MGGMVTATRPPDGRLVMVDAAPRGSDAAQAVAVSAAVVLDWLAELDGADRKTEADGRLRLRHVAVLEGADVWMCAASPGATDRYRIEVTLADGRCVRLVVEELR